MHDIRLRGARTHNLQGISLDLRAGELVMVTGPSGAGKSSLAMDTLYAEGQRRFVESFSPYARQFLERLERPPIDSLDPIAATVAVDRRAPVKSSRSTLATMADLEPYLAALFAKESRPVCPDCGVIAEETSAASAATRVLAEATGAPRAVVAYALRPESPDHFLELRESLARDGFVRLVIGGETRDLDLVRPSDALAQGADPHVVVDRLKLEPASRRRIQQAIESAWERSSGRARVDVAGGPSMTLARGLVCPSCARTFQPAAAGLFSYNSALGACGGCKGFGRVIAVDWEKVIPDPKKSLAKGAIKPWGGTSAESERELLKEFCTRKKIPMDAAWERLTAAHQALVIDGEGTWTSGKYPGVRAWFKWLETRTYKMHVRVFLARYREYSVCDQCHGARLNASALAYRIAGRNLGAWHTLTVREALALIATVSPRDAQGKLARSELAARLGYLETVGLGYLGLDRQARTLSGGEAQRAGLTTALSATLTGALFVLDEPTVGLHPTDVPRLNVAMRELAQAGNAVLVIEHDERVIRAGDRVIELGPGAGKSGGHVLFDGTPAALAERTDTPTGRAWSRPHDVARTPRKAAAQLAIRGASEHNLKSVDVDVPLGVLCAISGPSGSGKSSLARDIVYRGVARALGDTTVARSGSVRSLTGCDQLSRVVLVDQSPLGRTARGNAATYTKAWDRIRARFAAEPAALHGGLTPAHFSFNVAGAGRCEACAGEGYETIEMQFLADVSLLCAVCHGKRFTPAVLEVRHRGLSVADVLAMTIEDCLATFDSRESDDPVFGRALRPCVRVGLGYLPLGQPLSTLSGGEAQRLKLARALSERAARTLFVLDEPSAGLHAQDTRHVIDAMHALVDDGASVVVVEHDLDVLRAADWLIDLGPDAGPDGGEIVAQGTPLEVAACGSRTGRALSDASAEVASAPLRREPAKAAIVVERAREHNLKAVSCEIPHGKLCVVTGPSGSGKSSLAFDVVFAEGQRRFMETLTPYARQFLPTLPRPEVDRVVGVPPSVALEQRTTRGGANSTVATVTEVAHYLRLLFAKLGEMRCPACDTVVAPSAPDDLFERLVTTPSADNHTLYAPAVRARKGTYLDVLTAASRGGVQTARIDGAIVGIDPPPRLAKTKEHTIDLIVYFGPLAKLTRAAFDRALAWGSGALRIADGSPSGATDASERLVSTARACPACGTGVPELDPRWFSFNTKQGQCEACEGSGVRGGPVAAEAGETKRCPACAGTRLALVPRKVQLFGSTYSEATALDVSAAHALVSSWRFHGKAALIGAAPHAELLRRLAFARDVGLGYLALDRAAATLSGGEMQRLRLSAQLGSGLTGALYVLDEPTIGLHPRDTRRLIDNLRALTASGSTVLVVEHDADTIRAADHLIDLGPSGGRAGGQIIAAGPAADVLAQADSPTAQAIAEPIRAWRTTLAPPKHELVLTGARAHNLKDVTLRIPLGRMTVVAGVSGSGKSTLVRRVLYPALRRALGLVADAPGAHGKLTGHQHVQRALAVDQSPIGRTPRSVPATFLGIWDELRKLFAGLPEAKIRGYSAARFSFNTPKGGRCPACEGQGAIVSEMAFLPDVVSPCETCGGTRFEPATLEITYAGRSIGDVLHLSAEEAAEVFVAHPKIARPLATLRDLGVGYLQLGQGSHTLSGGEAQRLKLAAELTAGSAHEPTVYVLDEPTTGLHLSDARRLVAVLDRLVARGDTLVIVEHHPDVIASADHVIELGPDGGTAGGTIVYEGTAAKLGRAKTATGRFFASLRASLP